MSDAEQGAAISAKLQFSGEKRQTAASMTDEAASIFGVKWVFCEK